MILFIFLYFYCLKEIFHMFMYFCWFFYQQQCIKKKNQKSKNMCVCVHVMCVCVI